MNAKAVAPPGYYWDVDVDIFDERLPIVVGLYWKPKWYSRRKLVAEYCSTDQAAIERWAIDLVEGLSPDGP